MNHLETNLNCTSGTIARPFTNLTWEHLASKPDYLTCQIGHAGIGRTAIARSVIARICSNV